MDCRESHFDIFSLDDQHGNVPPKEGNVLHVLCAGTEETRGPFHAKPHCALRDTDSRGNLSIRQLLQMAVAWKTREEELVPLESCYAG